MIYQKKLLGDTFTPVSTFLKVAAEADRCFLLESVEGGERIGRYSFLGTAPQQHFSGSFREFRQAFREFEISPESLPPFCGGAVGLFSYDLIREFEPVGNGNKPGPQLLPGQCVHMDFYSTVLVFDHLKHEIVILSHEGPDKVEEWEERLLKAEETGPGWAPSLEGASRSGLDYVSSCGYGGERFQEDVEQAKQYIVDGDIFQVVLSQRFEVDYPGDPFNVYRALRFLNPSPYHFFLKQGDLAVAGASPEMLVRVQGDHLECRPIAGTRRRGKDSDEDERLAEELKGDAKERAEHLMLVDLGRNDLGRVCRFGSVEVDDFMFLERYSHVMHLVSSVSGRLRPEFNALDALQACFPAGTVSGAPKVRAMQIIDEMEPWKRGVYAGAVGYLDYTGNLDTCIAIRTIVFKEGKAYVQAGAGIVADSNPAHEDMECHNKARVLFRALEMGASS
ncbi:MAG TPA: anthranilate synthase component I family protein [Acidobacteriota bacterium]|nr:anthranilate synthase component I family protein [Acidobacteriota bacterium]